MSENGFAAYFKSLVRSSGYSYRELGRLANVEYTYISKIANGKADRPSPEILNKLAPVLRIPYEELMAAAGYLPQYDPNEAAAKTIEAAISDDPELLEFWQELVKREDLQLLFKQVKPLSPGSIKKIIKIIKAIEDEEAMED